MKSASNNLFEWHLYQQTIKQTRKAVERQLMKRQFQAIKTDLDRLNMAYDHTGKLNLQDVRPSGFLIQSKG